MRISTAGFTALVFVIVSCMSITEGVVAQLPDGPAAAEVLASPKTLALVKQLSSDDLPVLKWSSPLGFSDITTNAAATVLDPAFSWDSDVAAPPYRLMFFTSASDPLKDLSQLDPAADARQLAFYDGRIAQHVLHFLAVAGLAPPAEKRREFSFRLRAGGGSPLFCETGCLRLFVTYSGLEGDVRQLGGIPVTFVAVASLLVSDPAETWSARIPDLDGTRKDFLFAFETSADSLSGRVAADGNEWPISNSQIDGTKLRFTIKVVHAGAERNVHFFGDVRDDAIKFVRQWTERTSGGGGQIHQLEFTARRRK